MAGAEALYCYTDREGSYSLYVSKPSAAAIVSGVLSFKVTVLDYARPVSVTAQLHGLAVPMSRATRGEFWSVWSGSVDTTQVPDGVVSLEAAAALDDSRSNTLASYLVLNGNEPPYAASGDAVVKLQVRGVDAADEVWLNGERLGVIPAGTANETTVAFPAPARLLKRANKLTVRAVAALGATDKDDFNVGSVWMEYAGKRFHDIRYVVFARHQIGDGNPAAYGTEKDLYLCLP
jgi:hypothetical protein